MSGRRRWGTSVPPFLLELTSALIIAKTRQAIDDILSVYSDFYHHLAYQRAQIQQQLQDALARQCTPYEFKGWQRVVKYKYSLHPLCTKGSLSDPGGRFNIGEIDLARFPTFSALYLASGKETALAETLGAVDGSGGLTAMDLALTNEQSITIVAVEGTLESVFDLRDKNKLKDFVALVKDFTVGKRIRQEFVRCLKRDPRIARSVDDLYGALLAPNWKMEPMQLDVPAASQVFGHIAFLAGVEGILYPSKFTQEDCLAIFPRCLTGKSFVSLQDEPPNGDVPSRIDSSNCGMCERTFAELAKN